MLSKAVIKFVQSLQKKKFRQKYNNFLVEGDKMVSEILRSPNFNIHSIYALDKWLEKYEGLLKKHQSICYAISEKELKSISGLKTPNQVLCILEMPQADIDDALIQKDLSLVLDHIQDPGNMGTILRTADWFGIQHVFCFDCVDVYNPKVIQASMGAFLRVKTLNIQPSELFERFSDVPVYGTTLNGTNIYTTKLSKKGFIIIGNEGRGIREETAQYIQHNIAIPAYGNAESLNVAVATGVICAAFRQNDG